MRIKLDIQRFAEDGEIVLRTRVDNSGLKRDLKETEKVVDDFDKKTDIETNVYIRANAKEFEKKMDDIDKRIENKEIKIHYADDTPDVIGVADERFKEYSDDIISLEQAHKNLGEEYSKNLSTIQQIDNTLDNVVQKEEERKDIVATINGVNYVKRTDLGTSKESFYSLEEIETNTKNISRELDKVGKKFTNIIKKVGRWALAIIGVRTAISLVTRAFSTLSQYNDELRNKLEDIRLVMAVGFEGAINKIINLVITLLNYLNYVSMRFFGLDLFKKADEYKSKKIAQNMAGAAGSAKEMRKQLAGFDEMNVLNDTSGSGGGGGGKANQEQFDLPRIEPPKWFIDLVDFIEKHKDAIISAIAGITTALILMKTFGLDPIKSLGIGIAVAGILYTILSIKKYLEDPTFTNFVDILKGIAITVAGVAIAFGLWPVAIAAAVALAVLIIVQNFDKIMGLFDKLNAWLDEHVLGWLKKKFGTLGEVLYMPIKAFVELARTAFQKFYGGIKSVIEGVMLIFQGDFFGGIKKIFGGLLNIMTAPLQSFIAFIKSMITQVIGLFKNLGVKAGDVIGGAFKGVVNGVLSVIEYTLNSPIRAINKLINVINKLPGVSIGKLSTFNLPRLASGAVINQPGHGVPIGGAIAGEAGREGILPLTDRNAMELLGKEIGKWITLNANIPVSIGNRQIAREVRQLMAQDDFAMNN